MGRATGSKTAARSGKRQPRRDGVPARLARGCGRLLLLALQLGVIGALLALIAAGVSYVYLSNQLAGAIERVVSYQGSGPGGVPRFFDRNGQLLFELQTAEKRRWIDYEEVPRVVIDATIAVEDDTFWRNPGFDAAAIGAALLSNVRNEDSRPIGASTITQQLVRHIAFSYEERVNISYERKLREVFLAFILTQQRSKREILTMYLNEIYYGNLAYGIEAAARTYFGKAAADLTLGEAAFLAGLPQSPVELDPYHNMEGAKARQEFVLQLMVDEGLATELDARVAAGAPLHVQPLLPETAGAQTTPRTLQAPHFVLYVQRQLEARYGPDALTRGGWQITTSLDLNIQNLAEQALREQVAARAAQHDVNNGAAVVLKPANGEILAMVGSLDYFDQAIDGQVNVALSPRQPGSSIKPITYAAAMERGWTAGDVLWDVPIKLVAGDGQTFVPTNYDGRFHGPLLLRDALANSYNIPPIQLIRDIGVGAMIATARKMGVESLDEQPGYYGLVLTLGGGEVTLLELTQAYATLANLGQRPRLTPVLRIVDGRGRTVYDAQQDRVPASNALDPRIAYILTDILDDDRARAPAMGLNNALNLPFPAAAKTGTTNDFRDNWTLGYTPGVVAGVWLGNSDGHAMVNSSGLGSAAPVWRRIVEGIYADAAMSDSLRVQGQMPATEFQRPGDIEEKEVCFPRSVGGTGCGATRRDLFVVSAPAHSIPRLGYVPDTSSNPGAWTLAVLSLPAEAARRIQLPVLEDGSQVPAPTQCAAGGALPASAAQQRLYLPVPPYYPDEVVARQWAQRNGYQMAPSVACPADVLRLAGGGGGSIAGGDAGGLYIAGNYHISSPRAGETVSGQVPIVGTANFDRSDVQFYKLEIGAGNNPSQWTTLGETHDAPVLNGVLEVLHAYALAPGPYVIRLVLVRQDGNYPPPETVPIVIAAE
ncbi:MAG TPA: transglycosylase domain-containing protein [Candidatus Binatia bacterium]|nr:transglycosylase domain-containing protein [Candidatus Binatia bacterium]